MWIIIATVLLLYLLGFMFICYLNGEKHHGNPSSSDNNSISASNNERGNFYQRHQPHRRHPFSRYHQYHRLFFNRLVSSNYHSCLAEDDDHHHHQLQQQQQQTSTSRQGRTNSNSSSPPLDPSTSALFAYRQQQLRQIHHEINEMSYLLGASQSQSDQRAAGPVPVPIRRSSSNNLVQPLCGSGGGGSLSGSNYFNRNNLDTRYSFVHQLMSTSATGVVVSTSSSAAPQAGESASSTPNANANNNVVSTPGGGFLAYQSSGSSLSYSPSGSESCHIVRERQRRLRHIRMELEGLSLQLSNVDDRCGNGITPPILHGATTTSSSLLMSVSPSSAETNFGLENNSADSSSMLYFPGGNSSNGNSWLDNNDDDDLPGYESIVCVVDSRQRAPAAVDTLDEQMEEDESPPPSYSEAVHLYSFGERGERKK